MTSDIAYKVKQLPPEIIRSSIRIVKFYSKCSLDEVISEHRLLLGHEFYWDHVEILDEELYLGKRLVSEMLHIKKQTYNLNSQTDTEGLHETYFPIINKTQLCSTTIFYSVNVSIYIFTFHLLTLPFFTTWLSLVFYYIPTIYWLTFSNSAII